MLINRPTAMRFDRAAEIHQLAWRKSCNIAAGENGKQNGVERDYILPSDKWLLGVWQPIRSSLGEYLEVSGVQANTGKHNLKSSWTQCANVFFPFRQYPSFRTLFARFLADKTGFDVDQVEQIEFEYAAPGTLEPKRLLGETKGKRGSGQTSPDIAVIFGTADGKSGLYLIENKYTEHSFYDCSGAKPPSELEARGLEPNPNPERCKHLSEIIADHASMCHEHKWGRRYWEILHDTFDAQIAVTIAVCPALRAGYQLMRQQALAEGIVRSRLFDFVVHGVSFDERNYTLVSCLKPLGIENFSSGWGRLFRSDVRFVCFTHQELVSFVERQSSGSTLASWVDYVSRRYGYSSSHHHLNPL